MKSDVFLNVVQLLKSAINHLLFPPFLEQVKKISKVPLRKQLRNRQSSSHSRASSKQKLPNSSRTVCAHCLHVHIHTNGKDARAEWKRCASRMAKMREQSEKRETVKRGGIGARKNWKSHFWGFLINCMDDRL